MIYCVHFDLTTSDFWFNLSLTSLFPSLPPSLLICISSSGLVALRPSPAHKHNKKHIIIKNTKAKLKWKSQFSLESRRKYCMYTKYTKRN